MSASKAGSNVLFCRFVRQSWRLLVLCAVLPTILNSTPFRVTLSEEEPNDDGVSSFGIVFSDAVLNTHLKELVVQPRSRASSAQDEVTQGLLRRAHSHNDYNQRKPLMSALRHGMSSVEVDVFPRDGKLLVGHTRFELKPGKTLESMYIRPILLMLRRSGSATPSGLKVMMDAASSSSLLNTGERSCPPSSSNPSRSPPLASSQSKRYPQSRVHCRDLNSGAANDSDARAASMASGRPNEQQEQRVLDPSDDVLTLLIDLKADPDVSLRLLHKALEPLRPYLTKFDKGGRFVQGKITVLISGNRPRDLKSLLLSDRLGHGERYLFIDGRAYDINENSDSDWVPLISTPWRGKLQLAWMLGRGSEHMRRLANKAHQQGKRLRIWGAPNEERIWRYMVASNVDLMSIDDHPRYARFATRFGHRF